MFYLSALPFSIPVTETPPSSFVECIKGVLKDRGERLLASDEAKGRITTAPRVLGPDELRKIAVTEKRGDKVQWVQGMVQLTFTFAAADGGPARMEVTARILGKAQTFLPLMRPSDWLPLPSNGILEGEVLAAMRQSCGG